MTVSNGTRNFSTRKECPICKNSKFTNIQLNFNKQELKKFLINYYNIKDNLFINLLNKYQYSLLRCELCKSLLQKEILNNSNLHYLYNNIIPNSWHKNDINAVKNKFLNYTKSNSKLAEFLQKKVFNRPIQVLDYGSGEAYYINLSGKITYSTYDLADKHSIQNTKTSVNNLENKQYDLILLNQVLEHAEDPSQIINKLEQILSPGGILKIENPSSSFINLNILLMNIYRKISKKLIEDIFPLEHINCISSKGMNIMTKKLKYMPLLTMECFFIQNKGFKALYKYISIKFFIFRLLSSILINKNGGHYLILKKTN
jgi:SAM-dependent methyltransferase